MKRVGALTSRGFTIVELLVVIVVIAILAAITIVSYNGVTNQARETTLKSDLRNASTKIEMDKIANGEYPSDIASIKRSNGTELQYSHSGETFCLSATNANLSGSFYLTQDGALKDGLCPSHVAKPAQNGALMQTITSANCSPNRIMAVDARDNRTYWVQKLADGKCWMLTNLAYAGGGSNTYGDVKAMQNGTGDATGTYTVAKYYVSANANPTTSPAQPSLSTDGGATNPQYGYAYNWCAAMGVQSSTAACGDVATPVANTAISICPANWRLPTGGSNGEFNALFVAVNGGIHSTDAGLLSNWLGQRGGQWYYTTGFRLQGTSGYYWASTPLNGVTSSAFVLMHSSTGTSATGSGLNKTGANPVRCIVA